MIARRAAAAGAGCCAVCRVGRIRRCLLCMLCSLGSDPGWEELTMGFWSSSGLAVLLHLVTLSFLQLETGERGAPDEGLW